MWCHLTCHRFLWVTLQLDSLKKCPNQDAITSQLSKSPRGLEGMYDHMFTKLKELEGDTVYAVIRILQWVAFALTNLSLEQILEVPGISSEAENGRFFHEGKKWTIDSLKLYCGNLISVTENHVYYHTNPLTTQYSEHIKSYLMFLLMWR